MDEIKWEEPPHRRTRKGSGRHAAIAAQLQSRPGEWAVIDTFDSPGNAAGMAWNINNPKRMVAYQPAGAFEAVSRTVDGEYRLYVRYVGAADD